MSFNNIHSKETKQPEKKKNWYQWGVDRQKEREEKTRKQREE
jgi:hypothetical protein